MQTTSPDDGRYSVGVIGCGFIGRMFGERLQNDDRAELAAITDVDTRTRAAVGNSLGLDYDARYDEYTEMLSAADLDAVAIATPHTLHFEQIVTAIDRGLDVLCEKPLTTDLERGRILTERANSSDTVLMVGYQRHLNPSFERARDRWAGGSRSPTFITAEITQHWIDQFENAWRTDPELSGGGYLYDTGSHILDAICWTTGLRPAWVEAEMEFADATEQVDTRALLTIGFENGATASVSLFGDAPATREHIHIWDDDGAVYLEGREWETRSYSEVTAESETITPYIRDAEPTKIDAFLTTLEDGTEPPATAEDALVVTAISEAAYESARTGDRVTVDLDW